MGSFLPVIHSAEDISDIIQEIGFLPFFKNEIEGFSIADICPPELWFSHDNDGPWEWKGPVIRNTGCAYGKFYRGKACYISRECFPDFANYRRDGYDYDSRRDEGISRKKDHLIMEKLDMYPSVISHELKKMCCIGPDSKKSFDSSITYLQMQCYVLTSDIRYMISADNRTYGWGVAVYSTPEQYFGDYLAGRIYNRSCSEARYAVYSRLKKYLKSASEIQIERFIG